MWAHFLSKRILLSICGSAQVRRPGKSYLEIKKVRKEKEIVSKITFVICSKKRYTMWKVYTIVWKKNPKKDNFRNLKGSILWGAKKETINIQGKDSLSWFQEKDRTIACSGLPNFSDKKNNRRNRRNGSRKECIRFFSNSRDKLWRGITEARPRRKIMVTIRRPLKGFRERKYIYFIPSFPICQSNFTFHQLSDTCKEKITVLDVIYFKDL